MASWLNLNWGNLLSAIGLAFTIFALLAARRAASSAEAAKAASEATRRAMTDRTIIHALADAKKLCSELTTLLSTASFAAALIRSQDLGQSLRYIVKRWSAELTTSLTDLAEAQAQTDSISERLQLPTTTKISAIETKRLLSVLQRLTNTITSAHAMAEKKDEVNGR